jgi:GTPase SAR1 family protein
MPMRSLNSKWHRILVVEGTSGVGKSTLVDLLLRRHVAESAPRSLRSVVHLSQAHTYGPVARAEDLGTLTAAQDVAHLDSVVRSLEWLAGSLVHETKVKLYAVVDTLHLTHCFRPGVVTWSQVGDLDERLARIGAKLVVLRASEEAIWT